MALTNLGVYDWGGGRDIELHRNYWVKFLIETSDSSDGPQTLTYTPGLPAVGSTWVFGNDSDSYALCKPIVECETVVKKQQNFYWILKYEFSTRPWRTCATVEITNPLSQPDRINGSFVNYQEMVNKRRDDTATGTAGGAPILSSSLEPIYVQKDVDRPSVQITQTVLSLGLDVFSQMVNTLNDATLWGLPARCIKLRNVPWRRMVWGLCTYYYERTLEFDIKYDTFDETEIRDVGHRWLDPDKEPWYGWIPADRLDIDNFTEITDGRGNVLSKPVLLNGEGEKCTSPTTHEHFIPTVELYDESNFLTLGVPATL